MVRVVKVAHPDRFHIYYNRLPRFSSLPRRRSCPTTVGEDDEPKERLRGRLKALTMIQEKWSPIFRMLLFIEKKKSFKVVLEIHNCDFSSRTDKTYKW